MRESLRMSLTALSFFAALSLLNKRVYRAIKELFKNYTTVLRLAAIDPGGVVSTEFNQHDSYSICKREARVAIQAATVTVVTNVKE